jgi:hypothetical protein
VTTDVVREEFNQLIKYNNAKNRDNPVTTPMIQLTTAVRDHSKPTPLQHSYTIVYKECSGLSAILPHAGITKATICKNNTFNSTWF